MSAAAPAEEAVLASPHRFMLVSDLDWTMVRPAPALLLRSGPARCPRQTVQGKLAARCSSPPLTPSPPPLPLPRRPQVDHKDGTHDKLRAFNRLWLSQFAADSLLVFSTGRSPELFHELAVRTFCLLFLRMPLRLEPWHSPMTAV